MKTRTCKICREKFEPNPNMFCPPTGSKMDCMIEYSNQHLSKKAKEKKTQAKRELKDFNSKDITTMKTKAQNAFNAYIRERDKGNDCISCGCKVVKGDASHFFSVGSHSAVRFHVDNVHLSCYKCNRFLHGNLVPYKVALLEKIGQERFDKLKAKSKDVKLYSTEYYQKLIRVVRKKIKRIS